MIDIHEGLKSWQMEIRLNKRDDGRREEELDFTRKN
jgi:hypothetical protein